jgi:hypothetical protein
MIKSGEAGAGAHLLLIRLREEVLSVHNILDEACPARPQTWVLLLAGYKASLESKARIDGEKKYVEKSRTQEKVNNAFPIRIPSEIFTSCRQILIPNFRAS